VEKNNQPPSRPTTKNHPGAPSVAQPATRVTAAPPPPRKTAPVATVKEQPYNPKNSWDEKLQLACTSASIMAESFRRLRTQILHPLRGKPARTIMVTSSVPEEGKSFVCANLGIAFAKGMEQHALLVDCDMRRPTLAKLFGIDNGRGLADHLRHHLDLGQLIHKTSLEKLGVIPSGPPPANPAELLDSLQMKAMISEVTNRYPDRYIFFDTPPIHAAAETAVLAKHVDGIVLVVRFGKSGREQIKKLVATLGKEKIIGVVFNAYEMNMLEAKFLNYSHGYDYYYSGGYAAKE